MHTGQFAIPRAVVHTRAMPRTRPLSRAEKVKGVVAAVTVAVLLSAQLTVLLSAHAPAKPHARPASFGDRVSTLTGP